MNSVATWLAPGQEPQGAQSGSLSTGAAMTQTSKPFKPSQPWLCSWRRPRCSTKICRAPPPSQIQKTLAEPVRWQVPWAWARWRRLCPTIRWAWRRTPASGAHRVGGFMGIVFVLDSHRDLCERGSAAILFVPPLQELLHGQPPHRNCHPRRRPRAWATTSGFQNNLRIHAMGDVDELNSQHRPAAVRAPADAVRELLVQVQHQLFNQAASCRFRV